VESASSSKFLEAAITLCPAVFVILVSSIVMSTSCPRRSLDLGSNGTDSD
jgi:hypothetical protein